MQKTDDNVDAVDVSERAFADRLRIGCWSLTVLMVAYAGVDHRMSIGSDLVALHLVRAAVLAACALVVPRISSDAITVGIGVFVCSFMTTTAGLGAVLADDPFSAMLLCTGISWATAALFAWRPEYQAIVAAVGALTVGVLWGWSAELGIDGVDARVALSCLCTLALSVAAAQLMWGERTHHRLRTDQTRSLRAERDSVYALVDAMHRAEERFLARGGRAEVYQLLVDSLIDLTDSRYAFIAELDQSEAAHRLLFHAFEGDRLEEFRGMDGPIPLGLAEGDSLFSRAMESERGVVVADLSRENVGVIGYRGPDLASVGPAAVMPMRLRGGVWGLVAIGGREGGYDEAMLDYLEPFVATCAQLTEAYRGDQRRHQAEREVRRLNTGLERRVRERTAELEVANLELEAFSYSVSHDLRQPLRGMSGFAQILLEDYGDVLDDRARGYLSRVRESAMHMGDVIDDLLTLSRVTRSELNKSPVDLTLLAQSVVDELAEADPDRTIDIRIAPAMQASGDASLLRIALVNLIGNAWKFTSDADDATIEIGSEFVDGAEVFHVRDNGVGFDMAFADKLFHAFERLHDDAKFDGSGIGLAIVDRVIGRHGGCVWAESEPGRGATFLFTLGAMEGSEAVSEAGAA